MWRRVIWLKFIDVSMGYTTSIFRVEEPVCCFLVSLHGLFFDLKNRGSTIHRMSATFYQMALYCVGFEVHMAVVMKSPSLLKVNLQRTTQRYISEDRTWHSNLYSHHRKNLRSHKDTTEFPPFFPGSFFLRLYLFCFIFCLIYFSFLSLLFLRPSLFYFLFHLSITTWKLGHFHPPPLIIFLTLQRLPLRQRG
jgi:hypothetical protein